MMAGCPTIRNQGKPFWRISGNLAYKNIGIFPKKINEVTIHTLPHYIRLVFVRSSHLPFKMHLVVFRAFKVSPVLT